MGARGIGIAAVALVVAALAACRAPAAAPIRTPRPAAIMMCPRLPAPSIVVVPEAKPDERHERFDLADSSELLQEAPLDATAARYRDDVVARLGPDVSPRTLMNREMHIMAASTANARESLNAKAILGGRVGSFVKPSCLEQLLFARQGERYPMLDHPTEFGAFVLRRPGLVRVYMSGMDRIGQKIRQEVRDAVRSDVAEGFTLLAHIHNHPFVFDGHRAAQTFARPGEMDNVGGALAPSLSDVGFFTNAVDELGLQNAWLTNGFDAIRITATELAQFATHEAP